VTQEEHAESPAPRIRGRGLFPGGIAMRRLGTLPRGATCYGWDNARLRVLFHFGSRTLVLAGRGPKRLQLMPKRTLVREMPGRP